MKKLLKVIIGIVAAIVLAIAAVFYFTTGMVDAANAFFAAVKKQDMAAARGYLSEDFKANTDEAALKEFLAKTALLKFKEASWTNRQVATGGRGHLDGSVTTDSGGVVPLKIMFVKENGSWKIYSIQKPGAGVQAESESASSPGVPSKADQVALVKQAMHDFAVSIDAKSMEHFRSTVSQLWQKQITTEKLDEVFSKIFDANFDLTALDGVEPKIDPVSALGESGELVLTGYFPAKPLQVYFQQKYVYEGTAWKVYGFRINVK
jgi:hypothetical protein